MSIGNVVTRTEIWLHCEDAEQRWPRSYYFWHWVIAPVLMGLHNGVSGLRNWLRYVWRNRRKKQE